MTFVTAYAAATKNDADWEHALRSAELHALDVTLLEAVGHGGYPTYRVEAERAGDVERWLRYEFADDEDVEQVVALASRIAKAQGANRAQVETMRVAGTLPFVEARTGIAALAPPVVEVNDDAPRRAGAHRAHTVRDTAPVLEPLTKAEVLLLLRAFDSAVQPDALERHFPRTLRKWNRKAEQQAYVEGLYALYVRLKSPQASVRVERDGDDALPAAGPQDLPRRTLAAYAEAAGQRPRIAPAVAVAVAAVEDATARRTLPDKPPF